MKNSQVHIVVGSTLRLGLRGELETLENETFKNYEELSLRVDTLGCEVYNMSDFVDMCNNEELELNEVFITYVNLNDNY